MQEFLFKTLTVSQLSEKIFNYIEENIEFSSLAVEGEISNSKISKGHFYFSLKDEKALINCIMFYSFYKNLDFIPEDGMKVIVYSTLSYYKKMGKITLIAYNIKFQEDKGKLQIAFEKLKNQLQEEGIFDEKYKLPIPTYPLNVAIITSKKAAALFDIISIIKQRNKRINLFIIPASVQGISAPEELIHALDISYKYNHILDLVILTRGGGALEELWAFNNKDLVYKIFEKNLPVISAVGHEINWVLTDFVADLRAATPSNAAQIITKYSLYDIEDKLISMKNKLLNIWNEKYEKLKNNLTLNKVKISKDIFLYNIEKNKDKLTRYKKDLLATYKNLNQNMNTKIENLDKNLQLLSPYNILKKGYSIIEKDKEIITNKNQIKIGDKLKVYTYKDSYFVKVDKL